MTTFKIDSTHSRIGFKVKHMMFTNVLGQFNDFDATINLRDQSLQGAQVDFSAQVNSVNTSNTDRDNHLKSADFFDAENHPTITFNNVQLVNETTLEGDLTIKGITKRVVLNLDFGGFAKDPWGNTKMGMSVSGKINRKDFGLTWNAALETGGVLVGEEVVLDIELQFVQQ